MKITDNMIFIGLKLTQGSIDKIKSKVIIKHENVFCDHVTLWYFDDRDRGINKGGVNSFNYGEGYYAYQRAQLVNYNTMEDFKWPVLFKAVGVLSSDKCQTLTLSHINHLMHDCGDEAHVTLSTTGDVKPVYSNDMLYDIMYNGKIVLNKVEEKGYEYDEVDILLEGHIKFYNKIT